MKNARWLYARCWNGIVGFPALIVWALGAGRGQGRALLPIGKSKGITIISW